MKLGKVETLSNPNPSTPRRGEIWLVNFDPTIGTEIKKTRPALVISSDAVGRLPIKLVAPITEWKDHYSSNIWHVQLKPDPANGLTKLSAVDVLQVRGMDRRRFIRKFGEVTPDTIEEVILSLAAVVDYQAPYLAP